ncbi:phage tail sheath subtilisin-like domain-containing protein [Gluconacetobacter azotocaptans]|uniref:phage tail sheath subtilisin-like domain-containing protein n=1 Tax=Gluconacetobacter azotocaptans TaxID=142834 RepID=UPI00195D34EC|nr:phage tail sheath subtilisin-like domain-containing protein [Gluconacetobacter azotocaptans]MBM9401549.1 phage tail sheath subtilisin-like domain-containing protein [Gluconacetobacter azotocaptans]
MSGSITVPGYSDSNRLPGIYFALDATKANTASVTRRILIVGQMLDAAPAAAGVATISGGPTDAIGKYGAGSQCARMVDRYRGIDTTGEVWVLALSDDAAAVAATGSFAITGPASSAGTLCLYVGDQLVATGVSAGDTASAIAANVVAAASAIPSLPVSLAVDGTTNTKINVTALNKGLAGNDIQLGVNLLGTAGGQSLPGGMAVTITAMTGGTQNPTTLATALATMGDRVYDLVLHPYTDTASLGAFKQLFDNLTGRWSPGQQLYGHAITAYRSTYGAATTFGLAQNDPHATIMPISDSPSSPMDWAAEIGAQVAISMRGNPATPITGLALTVMPPSDAGRFIADQRNSLLHDGLSTFTVDDSGTVTIERLITTYQTNAAGVPDNSYLDIETLLTAEICLQDMRIFLASQFAACILVADGTKIPAGAKATTAQLVGKACIARYRVQAANLWVQNPDIFAANVVATNAGNGVVKLVLPFNWANQLRAIAGDVQFIKS